MLWFFTLTIAKPRRVGGLKVGLRFWGDLDLYAMLSILPFRFSVAFAVVLQHVSVLSEL